MFSDKHNLRARLYGVGLAVGGLLLIYGIVAQEALAAWVVLFEALLALALSNTPDTEEGRRDNRNAPLHDDYWE